jgi:carbonic anhydrase
VKAKGKFSALDMDKADLKDMDYASVILNVHTPSLHTIDGKGYDLELDVVHTLVNGEESANTLAVVSFLFESTKDATPFFDKFNPELKGQFEMNLAELVKGDLDVFYYQNHFTTPRI